MPYPVEVVDLVSVRVDVALEARTVTDEDPELTGLPPGGDVALAVAVLVTEPASTSAWVTE